MTIRVASRLTKFAFVFVVAIFASAPAFPQSQSTASPIPASTPVTRPSRRSIPPPQYIPAHDYDQRNIKLNLRFDWEREQAIGTATITFAPVVRNLSRVEFDAAYMTISGVTVASGAPLKFEYDGVKEKLLVTLDRAYQPAEEVTVVVTYHTNPPPADKTFSSGGGGLNFIKPRPDDPSRPKQIWTQAKLPTTTIGSHLSIIQTTL